MKGEDLDRPQLNLLAHHALNSENWAKALQYNREAAAHALGQSALHEAVGYLKHAIVALRNHEQSEEHVREAINIRLELRNALWAVGANDEILDQLNEAEQAAKSIRMRLRWPGSPFIEARANGLSAATKRHGHPPN